MKKITFFKMTPLQIHESKYGDWGPNHALLDSLSSRLYCPRCGGLMFSYDPEDEKYLKCHKCGTRKLVPNKWPKYSMKDGRYLMMMRDCFGFLFPSCSDTPTEGEK